jgi:hypothetical protein
MKKAQLTARTINASLVQLIDQVHTTRLPSRTTWLGAVAIFVKLAATAAVARLGTA